MIRFYEATHATVLGPCGSPPHTIDGSWLDPMVVHPSGPFQIIVGARNGCGIRVHNIDVRSASRRLLTKRDVRIVQEILRRSPWVFADIPPAGCCEIDLQTFGKALEQQGVNLGENE